MPWFANWGQVGQFGLQVVALGFSARSGIQSMTTRKFFSGGAILFYLLVGVVAVSAWFTWVGPSAAPGPCAVEMTNEKRQDLIRFFRTNMKQRHPVYIYFAEVKPRTGDLCPYAQDLWQALRIGGWEPPPVQKVDQLGGPGVIFGASTIDVVARNFLGMLSDTNEVHLDVKEGQYVPGHPQDWYLWIRDDWSEWIQRSLLK